MNSSILSTPWRSILETALDAVVVMDKDGNVLDWNNNATVVFGWSAEEVRGRLMADLIIPLQYREAHARGLHNFLATGEGKVLGRRIEICGLRRSGEQFPVELSISALSESSGPIFVGFLRDISERRDAERQRERHALNMETLYHAISFAAEKNSFDDALQVCLASVHKLTAWPLGHVYLPSGTEPVRLVPASVWYSGEPDSFPKMRSATAAAAFAPGEGLPGRVWESREPEWIANVNAHPDFPRAKWPGGIEIKSALAVPIISSDQAIAIIEFFSEQVVPPDPEILLTLRAIGQQVGRVIERRRAEEALREHASMLESEIAERIRAEQHQKFLLAEVNHRVKNMLAVVNAIAMQTARNSTSMENFGHRFLARLNALSEAHSLLTAQSWQAVPLSDLVEAVLSPYQSSDQLSIEGDLVMLPPKAIVSVGLVLHELVTNAVKYGALSVPVGRVSLKWTLSAGSQSFVRLVWQESGVGAVAPPSREGFGSAMIQACVKHDLKGRVSVEYGGDGIRYEFEFPPDPSN